MISPSMTLSQITSGQQRHVGISLSWHIDKAGRRGVDACAQTEQGVAETVHTVGEEGVQ